MKFITFSILALLLLSNSAFVRADNDADDLDVDIGEEPRQPAEGAATLTSSEDDDVPPMPTHPPHTVVIPDVVDESGPISLENPPELTPEQMVIDHDQAMRAFLQSGESKRYPNGTLNTSASTEGAATPISFETVKNSLTDLYKDSANLWSHWTKLAGDKWDQATNSLKEGTDFTLSKAYSVFYNVVEDLRSYQEALQDKAAEFTTERQQELADALAKFQKAYETIKQETKAKIEDTSKAASEKLEEGAEKAKDLYDEATMEFHRMKEVLEHQIKSVTERINDQAQQLSNAVSYDILRSKAKELYKNAADTLKELKSNIGKKAGGSDFTKKVYTTWGSVTDEINSIQAFFNKNFTRLSGEGRNLLDQLLTELQKQYDALRQETESLAKAIAKGVTNPEKVIEEAYENALSAYNLVRSKLQNEFDYLNGKITKAQYEAATGMKRNYERIVRESAKVLKKIEDASEDARNATAKILGPVLEKVREYYVDAATSFVDMDVRFAAYWDEVTGQLTKVKDNTSKEVRETFQTAIVEFQDLDDMISKMIEGYTGKIQNVFTKAVTDLENKYQALKYFTQKKYDAWKAGHAGDQALQESYEKAREEYLDSKEQLHVELSKYFDDEEDLILKKAKRPNDEL